jgi:hypothetical protein
MPRRKPPSQPRGQSGLLHRAGEVLWGTSYVVAMADCIGRDRKQVRRWLDGLYVIPNDVWVALAAETDRRRADLTALRKTLPL